jgi:F0F1-type ATP synthase assembly protein I
MGKAKPPSPTPSGTLRLAGMGMELVATILVACLLGYWIDRRFDTGGWGLIVLAIIGIVGGLYNLIRQSVHEMFQQNDKASSTRGLGDEGHSSDKDSGTET